MAEELTRILPASSPDLLILQELDAEYILPAETDSEDPVNFGKCQRGRFVLRSET